MHQALIKTILFFCLALLSTGLTANPVQDREAFVKYFQTAFPDTAFADFANGVYAIDGKAREQWQEIEVFPPYEFDIEQGKSLWREIFPDGKTYTDCFAASNAAIRQNYPRFDKKTGEVVTLQVALNHCRQSHGQAILAYGNPPMLALTAYVAYISRGKILDIKIPPDDPRALAAYEDGKRFYYSKRGQLNFACYDCHVTSAGHLIRADRLGPGLGQPTHFPAYRLKFGKLVSLQQRFYGCVRDVRAKPFDLQSKTFRNLEYFLSYMSNGLELNGPASRK